MQEPTPDDKADQVRQYQLTLLKCRTEFSTSYMKANCPRIPLRDVTIKALIGSGGFAEVYKGELNDSTIAIKKQNKLEHGTHCAEDWIREKMFLCAMDTIFAPKVYGTYQDSTFVYLYMAYAMYGDLYALWAARRPFRENQSAALMIQVAYGLEYFHACRLVYRDLKVTNCLIFEGGRVKIADFGLSTIITADLNEFVGTYEICAPEMYLSRIYNESVDWWSFGMMVYLLNFNRRAFGIRNNDSVGQIMEKIIMPLEGVDETRASKEVKDLVKNLLVQNPLRRLGTDAAGSEGVKSHPWFKNEDPWRVLNATAYDLHLDPVPTDETPDDGEDFMDLPPADFDDPVWGAY